MARGKKELGIGLVGYKFMGLAHSNAWMKVDKFFDLPAKPVMRAVCGRTQPDVGRFAKKWGWESVETDWRKLIERDDIDIIDITTPNNAHFDIAIAAAKAGKHVLCEKPLAMTVAEARKMVQAVKKNKVKHLIWHNYRKVPAVAFARELIEKGKIGRIFHMRAQYLQDWIVDPKFPLVWRLRKELSGSGTHGDILAHIIDLGRFLVGEFDRVVGHMKTFIKERPLEASSDARLSAKGAKKKGKVTVDDASMFLADFVNGAVGVFEATRFGTGHKNGEYIEINGEKGSLRWHFEDMNELWFFDNTEPREMQGFKRILVTEDVHPYVGAWWPPGHIIGYEHTFIHAAAEAIIGIAKNKPLTPDFVDGLRNQVMLDTVEKSAKTGKWLKVPKI